MPKLKASDFKPKAPKPKGRVISLLGEREPSFQERQEDMAYKLTRRLARVRVAKRMGIEMDHLRKLVAGYLRRHPHCRNVDNLLGGV